MSVKLFSQYINRCRALNRDPRAEEVQLYKSIMKKLNKY